MGAGNLQTYLTCTNLSSGPIARGNIMHARNSSNTVHITYGSVWCVYVGQEMYVWVLGQTRVRFSANPYDFSSVAPQLLLNWVKTGLRRERNLVLVLRRKQGLLPIAVEGREFVKDRSHWHGDMPNMLPNVGRVSFKPPK
jgi:hypothetical protein